MRLESKKLLWDMQEAGKDIQIFTANLNFDQYLANAMVRAAVERKFEIIGEALTQLKKIDSSTSARITGRDRIIGFRNVLIHGYSVVRHDATWRAVEDHLPLMLDELTSLLAEPESN